MHKIFLVYNGEDLSKEFLKLANKFEGVQFATITNNEIPTFLLYTPNGMFELKEEEFDEEYIL